MVLPFCLASDASVVRLGGREFHALIMFCGFDSVHDSCCDGAYSRLADVPKLTGEALGLADPDSSRSTKE